MAQLATVSRDLIEARIEELQRELAREQENLEKLTPKEPTEPNAVIRFRKYDSTYSFAAIKVQPSPFYTATWYITQDGSRTSRQGHPPKSWEALLEWIGKRNWGSIEVLS